jgi:hypothetical protein
MMSVVARSTALDVALVEHVATYSRRVRDAVDAQHQHESVCSPLGVWLLLCACLEAAEGAERERLEAVIGCSCGDAAKLLDAFLAAVPSALLAAIALWAREAAATESFARWRAGLPAAIERSPVPTQEQADAWADRNTLGLIPRFPLAVDGFDLVLASALATRVSWERPYEAIPARERFAPTSPWVDAVQRVLWTDATTNTAIVDTTAAGRVAVHAAVAQEDLSVVCVCADPSVDRASVFEAAREVGAQIATGSKPRSVSLFDLPLGDGHSWTIAEHEIATWQPNEKREMLTDVALPAWEIKSSLKLLDSPAFGAIAATAVLRRMIGDGPSDARQVALATFDRYGFKAAAVTVFAQAAAAMRHPPHTGVMRTASVRLDHPFAAIAFVGKPGGVDIRFRGLPVFEAWVHAPTEAPA